MEVKLHLERPALVFLLCWTAYAVSYMGRMNLAISIPAMEAAGVASLGGLGLAGSLYLWCYGCGHLINGALGDRFSPRLMIFWGLLLSAAVTLVLLCFLSFTITFINSILLGLVPLQYRQSRCMSTVAGLLDFVAYFAAGIFSLFSGFLSQASGDWKGVFFFLLLGVLVGAGVMVPAKREIRE